MDILKAEIARKRRAIEMAKSSHQVGKITAPPPASSRRKGATSSSTDEGKMKEKVYLKAADLRRFQEEGDDDEEDPRRVRVEGTNEQETHDDDDCDNVTKSRKRLRTNEWNEQDGKEEEGEEEMLSQGNPDGLGDNDMFNSHNQFKKKKKEGKHSQKDQTSIPSSEQITKMLRSMGLPIRLFGECFVHSHHNSVVDAQRYQRLQQEQILQQQQRQQLQNHDLLEDGVDEFRLTCAGHNIRNTFLLRGNQQGRDSFDNDDSDVQGGGRGRDNYGGRGSDGRNNNNKMESKSANSSSSAVTVAVANAGAAAAKDHQKSNNKVDKNISGEQLQQQQQQQQEQDPHKHIHQFFKSLLKQWENDLYHGRSDTTRKSLQGKMDTKTFKQCKDYIRPLFKLLKTRTLELDIMKHLLRIVTFCQEGEFVKAHDGYMDLAIGRAAWPIGVTMVGIHARSGRAKIESSKVAHVMNSELQRKYLTSVKRLMSYAQKKAEHIAPSKKVT